MKTIELRKYANRKIYDAGKIAYVTMLGVSDIVARGDSVVVTCDRTGEDVTSQVLARALYERLVRRVPGRAPFPSEALMDLIRKVKTRKRRR